MQVIAICDYMNRVLSQAGIFFSMQKSDGRKPPRDLVQLPSGHKVPAALIASSKFLSASSTSGNVNDDLTQTTQSRSSRFLPDYLKHRAKEKKRLATMESEFMNQMESEAMERQKNDRQRVFEEEKARKRERRQKRKLAKSSEGLDLPVSVVQEIKRQEVAERQPEPKPSELQPVKTVHPYAIRPQVHSPPKPLDTIRIIDED